VSIPLTVDGTIRYPQYDGGEDTPVSFGAILGYTQLVSYHLPLVGSSTRGLDLTNFLGAKLILITVAASLTASPVMIAVNGAEDGLLEMSPGSLLLYANVAPGDAPVTSLTIMHSTNVTVDVRVFGTEGTGPVM
jgi:hypothetical protein